MVEDRGPQIRDVAIIFIVLTWVSTILRCYVRLYIVKHFGPDDYLALASLISFSIFNFFAIRAIPYGSGRHLEDISLADIPVALKQWFFAEIFYDVSTTLTKFTIGLFLLRLSVKRIHIWIIRVVLGVIVVYAFAYLFLIIFQCRPIDLFWLRFSGDTDGQCFSDPLVLIPTYVHGALNATADWTLGLLPIFIVKDLEMNQRTKITVMLILALGAIGSIATLIRIKYISDLVKQDFLYNASNVAIWSTIEPGMGITAASLATLRPLFKTFFDNTAFFVSSNETDETHLSLRSRISRASYLYYGGNRKRCSSRYTPDTIMELKEEGGEERVLETGGNDAGLERKGEEIYDMCQVVQSQKHADEEDAMMRKQLSTRRKCVSWDRGGGGGGRDRCRSLGGSTEVGPGADDGAGRRGGLNFLSRDSRMEISPRSM